MVAPLRSSTSAAATNDSGTVDEDDHQRAPAQQERREREQREDAGHDQRGLEVVDALLDVRRRPEHGRVERHSAEAGLHLLDRGLGLARHVERARAGAFSITNISPGPVVVSASPISGGWSSTTVATSPSCIFVPSSVTRPSDSGVVIGEMCWMPSRWLAVSMNPPVPGVEASR